MVDVDASTSDDEAVFARTVDGQRELVFESGRLSPTEKRLLAAFTGFTPLRVLAELGLETHTEVVANLSARQLIAVQVQPRHSPRA